MAKASSQNNAVSMALGAGIAGAEFEQPLKGTAKTTAAPTRVMDRAWITGVAGAVAVFVCAYWFWLTDALSQGVRIAGYSLTDNRQESILAALFIVTTVMVVVEIGRLWQREGKDFFQVSPALKQGQYVRFMAYAVADYVKYLCIWWLVMQFFWWANEYGYQRNANYYSGWFRFIDMAWASFLWLGLPYIALTRALKHNPEADRRDLSTLFARTMIYLASWLPGCRGWRTDFTEEDKKGVRGLLVKLFFAPLMTVFFIDQFPHLVANIGYLLDGLPAAIANGQYSHSRFNQDFFNISVAAIFSVDVALAWCGYVVTSRWLDNHTRSVEPTLLGWAVCLVCYPPFQMFLGLYFSAPNERDLLNYSGQWVVTIFTGMMVLSYFVYMSATLWFGVRFSNLTHRGIIRTGPYSFIRHPAYAAKNFAWWCVMFPVIIWNASHTGLALAILQTLGLVLMTWFYYMRATTEERHLSADPEYREYCKQVKYRFFPGLL